MANPQKRASKITSPFQPKASRKAKEKTAPKSGKPLADMQHTVAPSKPRSQSASVSFEVQETKELYKALFQNNPTPIWIYDAKALKILAANKAATRRYGYPNESFLQ